MKRTIVLMAIGVVGSMLMQNAVKADDDKDYVAKAIKSEKPATVNGAADEGEYTAPALVMKQTPDRDTIGGAPASAKLFHDGKTLFVIITVPLKDANSISKGESWSQDDAAEVCLCDASGAALGQTFIIHGFCTGKHECTGDGGAATEAVEKLGKAVKYAAKIDKNSWTGEWAIPLEAVGLKYKPGLKLGFNLGAWRSQDGEWIIWRGANGSTFNLDNGGKLILE